MTKAIRIENADNSSHPVCVEVWEKGIDGAPDELVETRRLNLPTAMVELCIWDTRYLVISEKD